MEIVNHENEELKNASDIVQSLDHEVPSDEEAKQSLVMTKEDEALANSRQALATAEMSITTTGQFSVHVCAIEQLLISNGILKKDDLAKHIQVIQEQSKQLAEKEIQQAINENHGLSPDDTRG